MADVLAEEDTPISKQERDEILGLNEDMKMGDRARRQTEERRVGAVMQHSITTCSPRRYRLRGGTGATVRLWLRR